MRKLSCLVLSALCLFVPATALGTLFDFDSAPQYTSLPIDQTVDGITAHLSATGQGFSIQRADVLGFTPVGFAGNSIYPNSGSAADLLVGFSQALTDFSIMFAPEEYGCDTSARMRVTAYMNSAFVGTATAIADPPGTWPTGTLSINAPQGFNSVVVHYDMAPTCGDIGSIFMADNMNVTPQIPTSIDGGINADALRPRISPNPFGDETIIRFDLARREPVSVSIYDAAGRLIRTLSAGIVFDPGVRVMLWDGRDDEGFEVTSGVYLCSVRTATQDTATRMILLRER